MSVRIACRHACLFLVTGLFALVLAAPAQGVVYTFGQHADKERLVFDFGPKIPTYKISRTGERQLTLSLPSGGLGKAGKLPDFGGSRLVTGMRVDGNNVVVTLRTAAFGYVGFALDDRGKVVMDVFSDPLGSRWKAPATLTTPAKPAKPKGPVTTTRKTLPEKPKAPTPAKAKATTPPFRSDPLPNRTKVEQPVQTGGKFNPTKPQAVKPENAKPDTAKTDAPNADVPTPQGTTATTRKPEAAKPKRSFFSVPYVFRGKVTPPGQEAPTQVERIPTQSAEAEPQPEEEQAAPAITDEAAAKPEAASTPENLTQQQIVKRMVDNLLEKDAPPSQFRGAVAPPGSPPPSQRPMPVDTTEKSTVAQTGLPQPDAVPAAEPAAEQAAEPAADAAVEAEAENATEEVVLGPDGKPVLTSEQRQEQLDEIMYSAQAAQTNGDNEEALKQLDLLLAQPDVSAEMREEAMYMKADVLYVTHKEALEDNFDEVNGAYAAAVNFNPESWRVPAALLRRGVLNLKVGNIPEASAYFKMLRENFKGDPNVPLTYYYWGDYHFRNNDFQKAADEFQYLVQVYPDSKFVREASLGLARSLRKLGYDKQAFQIVDYIEKRWPRFYIEFPPFLRLLGDAAYSVKDYKKAKNDYWTYYNIDPKGDESDIILARLGDIYMRTDRPKAARELYEKAVADFPDREGGLISRMRMAEEGIYDEPSIEQMFTVFDRPLNLQPSQIYEQIVAEHPKSALAPLAQLKLGMWQLWNNKYLDAMTAVMDFGKMFPDNELQSRVSQVGLRAFGRIVDQLVKDENYPKIVNLWKEYDFVRDNAQDLEPDAKIALALSFWKRGLPADALAMVKPFMDQEQVPEYSEMAMSLALSIYVDNASWEKVLETGKAVTEWEISPDYRVELDYAKALAYENLGQVEKSRPLWVSLGNNRKLDERQRAYAIFFLALEALDKKQLRKAYDYAQDAYEILVVDGKDIPKIRESLRVLMDVTERSARYREALKWAHEYEKYVDKKDPSWPALRYRMAGLHRKGANYPKWREILGELSKEMPNTLYGRMAASDLQIEKLEQAARVYSPDQGTLQ